MHALILITKSPFLYFFFFDYLSNPEASLLRLFFGLDQQQVVDSTLEGTSVSEGSCVSASHLTGGFIKGSVLTGVRANHIEAEEAILVNVTADRIVAGKGSIVYNVVAPDNSLTVAPGEVLAGVFSDDGSYHIVRSDISIDGGKAWETVLADLGNKHSFEQVYNLNADACPLTLERVISDSHSSAWEKISKVTSANGSRKTSGKLEAYAESEKRQRVGLSEIEN